MNILKLTTIVITAAAMIGCASTPRTSQFDPSNKGIAFVEGKPYLIPYDSTLIHKRGTRSEIAGLNDLQIPHNCREGDRIWVSINYNKQMGKTYESIEGMNQDEIKALGRHVFRAGFAEHQMGCASALTATEYDYWKTTQVQKVEQVRHNQNLEVQYSQLNQMQQSNRPKTCYTTYGVTTCY